MKNQPLLLPLAGLIVGIGWAEMNWSHWAQAGIGLVLILIGVWSIYRFKNYFSVFVFGIFMWLGFLNLQLSQADYLLPNSVLNENQSLELKLKEAYKSSEKFKKYKAELLSINGRATPKIGVLIYLKDKEAQLFVDDVVEVNSSLLPLQKPLNPHQFDYARFLNRRHIHYSIFVEDFNLKSSETNSILRAASKLKKSWNQQLLDAGYSAEVADQISAMLLGDRADMDPNVEDAYRKTGVVHILAISGLHVVMIYSIFYFLLFPIQSLKNGPQLRVIVSLLLIWSFAAFVGFQAPVSRAALMISVYHISLAFKRKSNVYHSLTLAALVLLLLNPNRLFEVGFQLSFAAVFFIVYLHPVFVRLIQPQRKYSRNLTGFLSTTVSAQLGTMPFSIFYFNQTSGLFLLGNMVMIPAAFLMIMGGMLSLFLTSLGIRFPIWVTVFNFFIESCNRYIAFLAGHQLFVFDRISLSVFEVFLFLTALLGLRFLLAQPKFKVVLVALALISVFEIHRLVDLHQMSQKQEFIVFHQNKNSLIALRNGRSLDVFVADKSDSIRTEQFVIRPYMLHEKIKISRWHDISDYQSWLETKTELSNLKCVVLTSNRQDWPVAEAEQIVVDGSNYPNFQLDSIDVPIWFTRNDGAFIRRIR